MTEISYDAAVAAKKLAEAIRGLGVNTGLIRADAGELNGSQLLQLIGDATDRLNELQGNQLRTDIKVDIFWDRQGWYFHDGKTTSKEYPEIDDCIRAAHAKGFIVRDIRRTRGSVPQPPTPILERKQDAE